MSRLRPLSKSGARVEASGTVAASRVPTQGGSCSVTGVRIRGRLSDISAVLDEVPCEVDRYASKGNIHVILPPGSGVGHTLSIRAPNGASVSTTVDYGAPEILGAPLLALPTTGGSIELRGVNFGRDLSVMSAELRSQAGARIACPRVDLARAHTEAVVHVPPGVGSDWTLRLTVDGQVGGCPFAFAAPSLGAVKQAPMEGGWCCIQGSNLGEDAAALRAELREASPLSPVDAPGGQLGEEDAPDNSLPVRLVHRHVRVEVQLPPAKDAPSGGLSRLVVWVGNQRLAVSSPYTLGGGPPLGPRADASPAASLAQNSGHSPDSTARDAGGAGADSGGTGVTDHSAARAAQHLAGTLPAPPGPTDATFSVEEAAALAASGADEGDDAEDDPAIAATDGFDADDLLSELFGARSGLADGDEEKGALLRLLAALRGGASLSGGDLEAERALGVDALQRRARDGSASKLDGSAPLLAEGPAAAAAAGRAVAAAAGNDLFEEAVPWTPDRNRDDCELCARKFSLIRRRHHCRRCGRLVCHRCSAHSMWSEQSGDYVRVCTVCWRTVELRTRLLQCLHDAHLMAGQLPADDVAEARGLLDVTLRASVGAIADADANTDAGQRFELGGGHARAAAGDSERAPLRLRAVEAP